MMMDSVLLKDIYPDLRDKVITHLDRPIEMVLQLHLEYCTASTKLINFLN